MCKTFCDNNGSASQAEKVETGPNCRVWSKGFRIQGFVSSAAILCPRARNKRYEPCDASQICAHDIRTADGDQRTLNLQVAALTTAVKQHGKITKNALMGKGWDRSASKTLNRGPYISMY